MALRKPFVFNTEGFHEEIPVADSLDVGGVTINASGTGIEMNSKKITGLGDATAAADATNLSQVQALVASGNIFKEAVHAAEQMIDGAFGGIAALEVLRFANQPTAGDTIIFSDGTNTRTYTFVADQVSESAETDVSIETDAATAMQRLITRMNADTGNTWWFGAYHANGELGNEVHIIEESTPSSSLSTSRIYGTWTTQADFSVVHFQESGALIKYNVGTETTATTTDPAEGNFGLSRAYADLVDGEVHLSLNDNTQYSWEASAQAWNAISGTGAIPDATSGSGGGTKGLATFDEDKGLQVLSGGIAEVRLEANYGIEFQTGGGLAVKIDDSPDTLDVGSGGLKVVGLPSLFKINGTSVGATVTATNLTGVTDGGSADSLHTHTGSSVSLSHSDLGGVGSNDHHNQVHSLVGSDHTVSGLTTGHVLTATGATTFAFAALPTHIAEADRLESTHTTSTDATANGDPIYWNGADTLGKARADTDAKARVIGVVKTGGGVAPTSVDVVRHGICAGILTGATANTPYYLLATGGIGTTPPSGGNRVILIGYAANATDLDVRITDYGKRAA